jgi:hypothetical protein
MVQDHRGIQAAGSVGGGDHAPVHHDAEVRRLEILTGAGACKDELHDIY